MRRSMVAYALSVNQPALKRGVDMLYTHRNDSVERTTGRLHFVSDEGSLPCIQVHHWTYCYAKKANGR